MEHCFEINEKLLEALDEYHHKTMLMEKHVIEKKPYNGDLFSDINDDLITNVPIYDMGSRRYAAFCSFTEAVWRKEDDVKGNGHHFSHHDIKDEIDWFFLFYMFRLCGSGINYKPKTSDLFSTNEILGTHGFGNFWIVNSIQSGKYTRKEWINDLKHLNIPFTDNKGYLLPQFSFNGLKDGHLKKFIVEYSELFIEYLYDIISSDRYEIFEITDIGNDYLNKLGFKKQNFVLTAFAADLAEYFPKYVDPNSRVYAGTNAVKCIKAIFPKRISKVSQFDYINEVLRFQSERYNLNPIDCEDSRNCDVVRYFQEYQSIHHIKKNNGVIMKNNSILKKTLGIKKYETFKEKL